MDLSKVASTLSFVGALVIGIGAGLFADLISDRREIVTAVPPVEVFSIPASRLAPIRAENLVGIWTGSWGHVREECTIEIERVDGDRFVGTLRKEGAEIAIVGTLDPEDRSVYFRETKVLKLGPHMSGWSLGTNSGSFSADGKGLVGVGRDKWGRYGWDASKE